MRCSPLHRRPTLNKASLQKNRSTIKAGPQATRNANGWPVPGVQSAFSKTRPLPGTRVCREPKLKIRWYCTTTAWKCSPAPRDCPLSKPRTTELFTPPQGFCWHSFYVETVTKRHRNAEKFGAPCAAMRKIICDDLRIPRLASIPETPEPAGPSPSGHDRQAVLDWLAALRRFFGMRAQSMPERTQDLDACWGQCSGQVLEQTSWNWRPLLSTLRPYEPTCSWSWEISLK
jgi:hypothetical protein